MEITQREVELSSPLDVRGTKYPVAVSSGGSFRAQGPDGENVYGDTLDELRSKLLTTTRTKATKVEVPYTTVQETQYGRDIEVIDGVATGIHGKSHKVLARENGKAVQLDSYTRQLEPLDAEGKHRYAQLLQAERIARKELNEFQREHTIDLRRAVQAAIDAKLGGQ